MIQNLHQKVLEAVSCKQPILIELENRQIYGKIVGIGNNSNATGSFEKVAVVIAHQNPDDVWLDRDPDDIHGEIMDINYEQVKDLVYLQKG